MIEGMMGKVIEAVIDEVWLSVDWKLVAKRRD